MAKKLMIVESPTKSKTISNFLGKDFNVVSSMGHVRDLPKKKFGLDIENNNFKPQYVLDPDKRKLVSQIVEKAKKSEKIFLASDNDREGEAIAWHLKEILKAKNIPKDAIYRIVFNEITKDAILNSLQSLGQIDLKKVNAQQARRILDRIVGYKVSPILWKVIAKNLSAGRVQTVAMRLICEREEEIKSFVPEEYWTIDAELKRDDIVFTARLKKYKDKTIKIKTLNDADKLYNELRDKQFVVLNVEAKEKKVAPYPPFITSTLQQEASKILGFSTKKTMKIAQQLYEGVSIEGENTGLITYMRTDSVRVSEKANLELKKLIKEQFPDEYLIPHVRKYKNKNKAQDAHEAIRPTSSFYTPEMVKKFLTKDQYQLYRLIWERFVATQIQSAKIETAKVSITAGDGLFEAESSAVKFDGFFKVYPYPSSQYKGNSLPKLKVKDEVQLINLHKNQHMTKPPVRYTEASLVKKLEKEGIGRPSTYAPIIST
ncbi:MAG: type I DNA topoisomerase, partial [Candidatus Cloacimonadia bacterium]